MTEKDIIKDIIELCRQGKKEISQSEVNEIQKQLIILRKIVSLKAEEEREKSADYWRKAKLGSSYYFKKTGDSVSSSYTMALEAITKILDILRGEPLMITIQKVQRDSKGNIVGITTYRGKEQNLATRYNAKYHQVEYDLESSLQNLEKIEEANKAFVEHYANFYNIANAHIKSTRSHYASKGWRKRVNEGNIVEAFQRHMKMKHMSDDLSQQTLVDDFTPQEILILLYYSVGNVPWWQQGDIGYEQIKSFNNVRLASDTSIRRVATKILEMFSQEGNFNINDFNEIFTAHDQEQLINTSELTDKEIDNLLEQIKATNLFKGLGKT